MELEFLWFWLIGGADEYQTYSKLIGGPYEMGFRLKNLGRKERWSNEAFLFHPWHPGANSNGMDKEDALSGDGKGMNRTALEIISSERVYPLKRTELWG